MLLKETAGVDRGGYRGEVVGEISMVVEHEIKRID